MRQRFQDGFQQGLRAIDRKHLALPLTWQRWSLPGSNR
jgi:hypothetical protein